MKMGEPSPIISWLEAAILGRTDLDVTGESVRGSAEAIIDSLTVAVLVANLVLIRFLPTNIACSDRTLIP